jgi:heme A synthase
MLAGATGAVTALGDTLFPIGSLAEVGRGVSATAHLLQRLRVYHPYMAVSFSVGLLGIAAIVSVLRPSDPVRNYAFGVVALVALQIGAGVVNLLLRAPIAMQLTHLLLADLLWIDLVLLAAAACAEGAPHVAWTFRRRVSRGELGAEG